MEAWRVRVEIGLERWRLMCKLGLKMFLVYYLYKA